MNLQKNSLGTFQKVPAGYFGGYFSKEPTTYLLGNDWANCFRTHKELTMYLLGNLLLAPSGVVF
jgi:hypothetical protein